MKTIAQVVKQCLANQACRPVDEVTSEHTLASLNLDSLDMIQVATGVENELGLLWPDSNLQAMETHPGMTVQAYIEAVEKYVAEVRGE